MPVTGGIASPNTRRSAAASDASDCGVPLRVRDDHADVGGAAAARRRSACADRARRPVAVGANREQALAFGGVAAAQHFAEHAARRARGADASVSSTSAPAPSPNRLPSRAASNGRSASPASSPHVVVVEHHLRLDRRLVADRDHAIGFAVAQRLGRLDDRQQRRRRCGW